MRCSVHYQGGKYKVSFKDKLKIVRIKLVLNAKRIVRRMRVFVPQNMVLYLIVTFCWLLFAIVTYYFGKNYIYIDNVDNEGVKYTVLNTIWELKNSYFTSVVLVLFITSYNQNRGYKDKLLSQHLFYVDSMHDFEQLFKPLIKDELANYMPFYNDKTFDATLHFIKAEGLINNLNREEFEIIIDNILLRLEMIDGERRKGNIIGMHDKSLSDDIYNVKKALNQLKKKIK